MFYEEIRKKIRPFLHINLLIKYSVQQQIRFNGNVFGNKRCHYNEGSLYRFSLNFTEVISMMSSRIAMCAIKIFFILWLSAHGTQSPF